MTLTSMNRAIACGLALLAVLALNAPRLPACSTPVYRYAMYNWAQAPYLVFHVYRGTPDPADEKVNKMIEGLGKTAKPMANIVLHSVNLADAEQRDALPEVVRDAAEAKGSKEPPHHLVFTPWGAPFFSGRLDEAAVRTMVESPARKKINELLDAGNATVLVLLTGKDPKANDAAEKAIKEVISRAKSGEIPVADDLGGSLDGVMPPEDGAIGDQAAPAEAGKLSVALFKLDRSDPAEESFVRNLRLIEPDLTDAKYVDEPMVFAAYGRGRALEPYIGKGIVADNLVECVAFLAGACSCMVKDENPGADLLVQWDWDATADRLAMNDPTLDGNGPMYEEFPADGAGAPPAASTSQGNDGEASATAPASPAERAAPSSGPEAQKEDPRAEAAKPTPDTATSPVVPPSRTSKSAAGRQMVILGIGFAVAAAGIVAAGIAALMRRVA